MNDYIDFYLYIVKFKLMHEESIFRVVTNGKTMRTEGNLKENYH